MSSYTQRPSANCVSLCFSGETSSGTAQVSLGTSEEEDGGLMVCWFVQRCSQWGMPRGQG